MLKKAIIPIVFFLAACVNHKEEKANNNNEIRAQLDKTFTKELILPLKLDSAYLMRADTTQSLAYQFVQCFRSSISRDSLSQDVLVPLEKFCYIDSLKQNNAYAEYVKQLDIGMVQNASAFGLGKINLQNQKPLFLWMVKIDSYEACPVFNGTYILGTYVNNSGKMQTILLSELFSIVDPPAYANTSIVAILEARRIHLSAQTLADDDMDVSGYTLNQVEFECRLKNDCLQISRLK